MTKSEKITSMISENFFLPQYIYTDIYVKEGKLEKEFCDCLIEFSSVYIAIQIKERNENAAGSNEEWFEKKVVKKAKSQLKDTFSFYKNESNLLKKLGVGIGQKQRSASGHSVSE